MHYDSRTLAMILARRDVGLDAKDAHLRVCPLCQARLDAGMKRAAMWRAFGVGGLSSAQIPTAVDEKVGPAHMPSPRR